MMRTALATVGLAAALVAGAGPTQAAPYAIRYGGSNTALAVDLGSVVKNGKVRIAWTYVLYRSSRLMPPRLEILAMRQAVSCDTHAEKTLGSVGYLATGAVVSKYGPDPHWVLSLAGSNTDLMLTAMCDGPDPAWTRLNAANVFALYRQAWR